jgi:O-antigen biosynthesis protein WbqP
LPIQMELIDERRKRGIFEVRPGITGLAQINAIDMSDAKLLAETDAKMLKDLSLIIYWKYIIATILGGGFGDRIKHEND